MQNLGSFFVDLPGKYAKRSLPPLGRDRFYAQARDSRSVGTDSMRRRVALALSGVQTFDLPGRPVSGAVLARRELLLLLLLVLRCSLTVFTLKGSSGVNKETHTLRPGSRRVAAEVCPRLRIAVIYLQNEKLPSKTPSKVTTFCQNIKPNHMLFIKMSTPLS